VTADGAAPVPRLRFRVGARTDVGRVREGNEDSLLAQQPLFAVADGMGGHQGGEVASKLALETLKKAADGQVALVQVVHQANRAVFDKAAQDPGLAGMGTTLTVFLVDGNTLRLAHVGDSRAYLLRDGQLQQITRDHTVVQRMVDEGRITAPEAQIHPQRSILTRALGVDEDVQVDQASIEPQPGDRLLLCSDGLTGMIEEDVILRILTQEPDPQAASDALVEAANQAGGQDNVTAMVLDVVEDGTGAAAETTAETVPAVAEPAPAVEETSPPSPAAPPARAAPGRRRPWRRVLVWLLVLAVLIGGGLFAAKRFYVDRQWFVGESEGSVALFRGLPAQPLGFDLSTLEETTTISSAEVTRFPEYQDLGEGITADSEEDARGIIAQMQRDLEAQQREEP
jgi:PPM family protein phosphatase